MGKKIDIIYNDREIVHLKDIIGDMVDNGLAVYDAEDGGVKFIANVRIIAGKQEE